MLNQVILVGRLVEDPVIKKINDRDFCEVKIAVQRQFKNSSNSYDTDFIKVSCWEYLAKNMCEYAKKGYPIGIKARIQVRTIKVNDTNIDINEIVGENITFLGKPIKNNIEDLTEKKD